MNQGTDFPPVNASGQATILRDGMGAPMMSATIGNLAKAMAAAQAELRPAVMEGRNERIRSRYATLANIVQTVMDALPRHGLCVFQPLIPCDGAAHVRTVIVHADSGEWISGDVLMPVPTIRNREGKEVVSGPQALASAITYARRYGLCSLAGVVGDEDDDGEQAQSAAEREAARAEKARIEEERRAARERNPSPMTKAQHGALMAELKRRFGDDRDAYLTEMQNFFGRRIVSTNDLTRDDVAAYLEASRQDAA